MCPQGHVPVGLGAGQHPSGLGWHHQWVPPALPPLWVPTLAMALLTLSPLLPPQVCGEKNRFEKLMEYFRNEDTNIDFMVSGWRRWCSAVPRALCPQGRPSHHAVLGVPWPKGCQAVVLSPGHCVPKSF